MLKSVMIPIVKNKNKYITDKENYRPICLANVFTKVIENVLLSRLQNWLSTTCSQFGFKAKHGTEMCVFILKELVRYYIEHGSCMYVTYLDASKAFDRVNHQKLFSKLIEAGAPRWCVSRYPNKAAMPCAQMPITLNLPCFVLLVFKHPCTLCE